jgi:hypothetical protein
MKDIRLEMAMDLVSCKLHGFNKLHVGLVLKMKLLMDRG